MWSTLPHGRGSVGSRDLSEPLLFAARASDLLASGATGGLLGRCAVLAMFFHFTSSVELLATLATELFKLSHNVSPFGHCASRKLSG